MDRTRRLAGASTWGAALAIIVCGGCVGTIGDAGAPAVTRPPPAGGDLPTNPRPTPGGGGAGVTTACVPGKVQLGPTPMRRLAHAEYDNTVRDLLGDASAPARAFPADPLHSGHYDNGANLGVSDVLAELYLQAAEALAATAAGRLATLLPCDPRAGEDACAEAFARRFGGRAFRRPLDQEELDVALTVYRGGRAIPGATFASAIKLVIQTFLQAPQFLYRVELGAGEIIGPARRLTDFELASRLSYALWATAPDEALLAAAAEGRLRTREGAVAEARRLLTDDRFKQGLARFAGAWMPVANLESVEKDGTIWSQALAAGLRDELLAFVDDVVRKGDGRWRTLMTASHAFAAADVARHYGLAARPQAVSRVELDPGRFAGLLTRAGLNAFLAKKSISAPVVRGKFVRTQILCQEPPPPPADVVVSFVDVAPGLSTRETLQQTTAAPVCAGCHRLLNPIGFGLENYDALGRWRDVDGGKPVDATGAVVAADPFVTDVDGPFDGPIELSRKLGDSSVAAGCFGNNWFRYVFGRDEEDDDACTLEQVRGRGVATGQELREIMLALVESPSFYYRREEVTP